MRRLLSLLLLVAASFGCTDPVWDERVKSLGPEPGPHPEGPLHRPGQPCTWCHRSGGEAEPAFALAGTAFVRASSPEPLVGATVHIFESSGRRVSLPTNAAGSFYLSSDVKLDYPLWIRLEHGGVTRTMQSPIFRESSCAPCHLREAGPTSPGPIVLEDPP